MVTFYTFFSHEKKGIQCFQIKNQYISNKQKGWESNYFMVETEGLKPSGRFILWQSINSILKLCNAITFLPYCYLPTYSELETNRIRE